MNWMMRTANEGDLEYFTNQSFRASYRARVVVNSDGIPVGMVGVIHTNPLQAFSFSTEELLRRPAYIARLARALREEILVLYSSPVFAVTEASDRLLVHSGFEYLRTTSQGRLYRASVTGNPDGWQHCDDSVRSVEEGES